ncbi:MAG: hypothetical protein Q9166_002162 [cf. Caloplaca sp. 2 TL-2023]
MPRLFGRKFVCFYCNRRSAQDRKAGVRQWQCEQCEAVNHLDENGEITDPPIPAQQTPVSTRYVQPRPRSLSPEANLPDRSLFCPRCLQNQHIVNQALAEYLPSQDDPRYPDFERALPSYRKKMEERFPQVCDQCAPTIEDRIRFTGYAAKTDHLRRMMDRTRGEGNVHKSWSWTNLIVLLGGLGWFAGVAGHLFWHMLGALPTNTAEDGLSDSNKSQSILMCIVQGVFGLPIRPSCNELFRSVLAYGFDLSLLCIWWNPKMQYKLRGGYGRIIGRADYYKFQLVTLAVRFVTRKLAARDSSFAVDPQTGRAIHSFSLILETLLAVLSLRSIQIDQRPQVSFQDHYEPLAPNRSRSEHVKNLVPEARDLSPPSRSRAQPFPIEKLAPKSQVPQQPSYQPPTPPSEEDAEDTSMDWTPQHNFRPARAYNTLQPNTVLNEPSPFHGALPPAPVSWAQRLRNPSQPSFRKASEEKKENIFGKKNKRILSDDASDVSSQFSPKSPGFMSEISSPVKFAPPRFFAPADRVETGLESLFEDTFSLSKDTMSRSGSIGQQNIESAVLPLVSGPLTRLVTAFLLSASCISWDYVVVFLPKSVPAVRTVCQLIAALISTLNAASSAALPRTTRSIGSATFYGTEAAVAMSLGCLVWEPWGYGAQFDFNALGLWFLIALTVQEIWDFVSSLVIPAQSTTAQIEEAPKPLHQNTVPHKKVVEQEPGSELRRRQFNQALKAETTVNVSTKRNLNNVQLSQRTTRSKARDIGSRRDSLGVDGLGSLSLGGW